MLVAVITNPELYHSQDIEKLNSSLDIVEFRLDYFPCLDLDLLKDFRSKFTCPVIFTLRKKSHGGRFAGCEEERLALIKKLMHNSPDYFDIECDVEKKAILEFSNNFPGIKLICSYHNFEATPEKLLDVYKGMKSGEFFAYKIASLAKSLEDSFRMLSFVENLNAEGIKIAGICMGTAGKITRILSPIVGSYLNYTYLQSEQLTAPGQIGLEELLNIYRYKSLNSATRVYYSLSEESKFFDINTINNRFEKEKLNSVCINLEISKNKLLKLLGKFPCRFSFEKFEENKNE